MVTPDCCWQAQRPATVVQFPGHGSRRGHLGLDKVDRQEGADGGATSHRRRRGGDSRDYAAVSTKADRRAAHQVRACWSPCAHPGVGALGVHRRRHGRTDRAVPAAAGLMVRRRFGYGPEAPVWALPGELPDPRRETADRSGDLSDGGRCSPVPRPHSAGDRAWALAAGRSPRSPDAARVLRGLPRGEPSRR